MEKVAPKNHPADWEESFVADEGRPLIPEGCYKVQCVAYERACSHHKALKMFLHFRIIDGTYLGTEIFMAVNLIDTKTGKPFKQVPRGSKYYGNWVIANHSHLPSRNDRMSPAVFKNGIFEAVVRTVKPKFSDGADKPDCFHYSIVDCLKRRLQ